MAISAKEVNELRKMTGAGMMDCKNALVEADGDFDKAVEILRKKGQKVSAKRADKEANEGSVFAGTLADGSTGFIFSMNCETDFVAKNDEFQNLGNEILNYRPKACRSCWCDGFDPWIRIHRRRNSYQHDG